MPPHFNFVLPYNKRSVTFLQCRHFSLHFFNCICIFQCLLFLEINEQRSKIIKEIKITKMEISLQIPSLQPNFQYFYVLLCKQNQMSFENKMNEKRIKDFNNNEFNFLFLTFNSLFAFFFFFGF
jgi:hypothetical protein